MTLSFRYCVFFLAGIREFKAIENIRILLNMSTILSCRVDTPATVLLPAYLKSRNCLLKSGCGVSSLHGWGVFVCWDESVLFNLTKFATWIARHL